MSWETSASLASRAIRDGERAALTLRRTEEPRVSGDDFELWEKELTGCTHPPGSLTVSRGRVLCTDCNRYVADSYGKGGH